MWFPTVAAHDVEDVAAELRREVNEVEPEAEFCESVTFESDEDVLTLSVGHRLATNLVDGPESLEVFVFAVLAGSTMTVVWTIDPIGDKHEMAFRVPESALVQVRRFDTSQQPWIVLPLSDIENTWWKRMLNAMLPWRRRAVRLETERMREPEA